MIQLQMSASGHYGPLFLCEKPADDIDEIFDLNRPLDRVCIQKLIFLFLNQNIWCGYSKDTVVLSSQNKC